MISVENAAMLADAVIEEAFTVYNYSLPLVPRDHPGFNAHLLETIERSIDRWKELNNFSESNFVFLWCDARGVPYEAVRSALVLTADKHIAAVGSLILPFLGSGEIDEYATMIFERIKQSA